MNNVKKKVINFRTTQDTKTFLEDLSIKYDRTLSYIINDFIEYFKNNPPKSIPTDKKK